MPLGAFSFLIFLSRIDLSDSKCHQWYFAGSTTVRCATTSNVSCSKTLLPLFHLAWGSNQPIWTASILIIASIWSCGYNGVKQSHIATWQHSYSYSLVIFDSVQVCSLHSPWGYMGNLALRMWYILSMPVCKIPRPIPVIFSRLTNIECIMQRDVWECFSPIITASPHSIGRWVKA